MTQIKAYTSALRQITPLWRTRWSLAVNLVYAAFQLISAVLYTSVWCGAVAVYYIVICSVRFLLLRHFRRSDENPLRELKAFRFCGILLFALSIAVVGIIIQMVRDGQGAQYPGHMIYGMAAYAFYRIVTSIVSAWQQRKMYSPVLAASKALNLATALMAGFSLQNALLATFGENAAWESMMSIITGGAVCLIIFCMAIFMVCKANRALKGEKSMKNEEKNSSPFNYTYSAKNQDEIKAIRQKYIPNEEDKLEQLRRLDHSVTKHATMPSLILGIVGTLILGTGMSMCMVWTQYFVPGVIIGIIGMTCVALAYPIYMRSVKKQREKLAPEIRRLSDELLSQ